MIAKQRRLDDDKYRCKSDSKNVCDERVSLIFSRKTSEIRSNDMKRCQTPLI